MSDLSAIRDLIDYEEDNPIMKNVSDILSKQFGRDIKVSKKKVVLRPSDMWKDDD